MDSLQTIAIKNIIDNISDNEELLSLKKHIEKRYEDNISQKHKEDYWGKEDGKFDDRLRQTTFSERLGCLACIENNILYRFAFSSVTENVTFLVNDTKSKKYWQFFKSWDDFKFHHYGEIANTSEISKEIPTEILDYAIFLWKHKSNIFYSE